MATLTPPQSEQTGALQIAALADQVRSKDVLVQQLTERLGAAAEELDRLQRSGADRRAGGGGPGASSRELMEQTGQLTCRVEEALDAWGQSSNHYEVILQRLDEIADHLSHSNGVVDAKSPARPTTTSHHSTSTPAAAAPSHAGPGQGSFWEKMKASMADGAPPPAPAPYGGPSSTASSATSAAAHAAGTAEPQAEIAIAPPPVVINVDTASIHDLREAVATRDAYITTLITELRMAHTLPDLPSDLMNSGLAPDELLASLMELETRLKTGVQRENLELALERARMGRERARMDQVKSQLEEQIKRMVAPPAEKEELPAEKAVPGAPTRNMGWLKRVTGGK